MKIGFDQLGVSAPVFYRRLVNALIIIVVPATGTLITQLPTSVLSEETKIITGVFVSYVVALLKALEFVLGTEQNS